GCWAHARRKWRDAMPDGATVKTSKAAVGYRYCTKLFTLEEQYGYATAKSRYEYRQNVVRPLLEEYFCWLKTVRPEKGSKLEEAVRYSLISLDSICCLISRLTYVWIVLSSSWVEHLEKCSIYGS